MLRRKSQCITLASHFLVLASAHAHHSYSEYDDEQIVEIDTVRTIHMKAPADLESQPRTLLLKPAELRRIWVYRPGEEVLPFNCKVQ